jgi:hypothetical protein
MMCGAQPELNLTSSINAMKLALMIGDLRLKMETVSDLQGDCEVFYLLLQGDRGDFSFFFYYRVTMKFFVF